MFIESKYPKFRVRGLEDEIELMARSGVEYGDYIITLEDNFEEKKVSGVRVYTNANLLKVQRAKVNDEEVFLLSDKPIHFDKIAVDDFRKCYIVLPASAEKVGGQRNKEAVYLDPNLREIKDISFYELMAESCHDFERVEKMDAKGQADPMRKVFCYDFIESFEGGRNPFEFGKFINDEQKAEFFSFCDALLKTKFENDGELTEEYYNLTEIAQKLVNGNEKK